MLRTCLDIAFAVSKLAYFTRNPSPDYFIMVKYIFYYLAGMLLLSLFYPSTLSDLNGFINAN
jgi:hypothetical protein